MDDTHFDRHDDWTCQQILWYLFIRFHYEERLSRLADFHMKWSHMRSRKIIGQSYSNPLFGRSQNLKLAKTDMKWRGGESDCTISVDMSDDDDIDSP